MNASSLGVYLHSRVHGGYQGTHTHTEKEREMGHCKNTMDMGNRMPTKAVVLHASIVTGGISKLQSAQGVPRHTHRDTETYI